MRNRLIAKQPIRVLDQESRCVQHDQHFGGQRFRNRLPGLQRDLASNFCLLLVNQS